jgi:putative ATP-dependent endonuclease of the OLD family
MASVRHISIRNFRGISSLDWSPNPGINAIIGPGDSAKTTVLEALDLAIGTRRSSFTDADFHDLDTGEPITIDVTIGDLPKEILNLEGYIRFLRGYWDTFGSVEDEPIDGAEPVITLRLTVGEDCEPAWCLFSKRVGPADLPRDIRGDHRALVSAQRIGATVSQHLAWGPRSVLTKLSDNRDGLAAVLANANRAARKEFTIEDAADLKPAVETARTVAKAMAVAGGVDAVAALDARAVNVSNGAIALHDGKGVPLRGLGLGSSRLLAAGLQAHVAAAVPILLLDEVEHGLEPHRIARMLQHLGSKSENPSQQVFLTTHSPVVLRELSADQLWVARRQPDGLLELCYISQLDGAQELLRSHPEVFLSPTVLICEGATEEGVCRGLDLYETAHGREGMALYGVTLADGGGTRQWKTAAGFQRLGFRVGLFRDSDAPVPALEAEFLRLGGTVFAWPEDHSFEDELFGSIPLALIPKLLEIADEHRTQDVVNQGLGSAGFRKDGWARVRLNPVDADRAALAQAAGGKSGWFKRIDIAEDLARSVLNTDAIELMSPLTQVIDGILDWIKADQSKAADGNA